MFKTLLGSVLVRQHLNSNSAVVVPYQKCTTGSNMGREKKLINDINRFATFTLYDGSLSVRVRITLHISLHADNG